MDPVRIDLGLRLVIDVPDYRHAGIFMDDVHGAIQAILNDGDGPAYGRFDFTHFHTRPCKADRMAQLAEMPQDFAVPETGEIGPRF